MKTGITILSIAAALLTLPAQAQQGPGTALPDTQNVNQRMGPMGSGKGAGPGAGPRQPKDCSKSQNPEACTAHQEARKKAMEACQGKAGPERKQCMHEQKQNVDCGKARNPQQCEARKQAYGECKGQTGPAFKQCVQQKMPSPDCAKSPNPQQCEQHAKVREACKDKAGPEHKACLREKLAPAK